MFLEEQKRLFKGRKLKKRDTRALFITRINAAVRNHGLSYSTFIHGLDKAKILLNRKMLSQIAIFDPDVFAKIASEAKGVQKKKEEL